MRQILRDAGYAALATLAVLGIAGGFVGTLYFMLMYGSPLVGALFAVVILYLVIFLSIRPTS